MSSSCSEETAAVVKCEVKNEGGGKIKTGKQVCLQSEPVTNNNLLFTDLTEHGHSLVTIPYFPLSYIDYNCDFSYSDYYNSYYSFNRMLAAGAYQGHFFP